MRIPGDLPAQGESWHMYEGAGCTRCKVLEQDLRELRGEGVGIQPYPEGLHDYGIGDLRRCRVPCPRCTTPGCSFRRPIDEALPDSSICVGRRYGFLWLKKCRVAIPHRHRECDNCGHEWIEHANPPKDA